jgi:3,4-dihydroxy 2-butanone 4-phosphate synthase/GTP cyclohydrolase II
VTTAFGEMMLHVFHDTIQDKHHLALVNGKPERDSATTVRVHGGDTLRDLLALCRSDSHWTTHTALAEIARAEAGVFVLLDDARPEGDFKQQLDVLLGRRSSPRSSASDGSGNFLSIGTGAQILRQLGVGKMRLLSSPWRFSALSGFDLEVVELVSGGA